MSRLCLNCQGKNAIIVLAFILVGPRFGLAMEENPEIALVREFAKAGDCDSQLRLAHMYLFGEGIGIDHNQAALWFNMVLNNSMAGRDSMETARIGLNNIPRKLISTNHAIYISLLELADKDDVEAQWKLAREYGQARKAKETIYWLERIIKNPNANHEQKDQAYLNLGSIYCSLEKYDEAVLEFSKIGCPRNDPENATKKLYEKDLEYWHKAQFNTAKIYSSQGKHKEALDILLLLSQEEIIDYATKTKVQMDLAHMYLRGHGGLFNLGEAERIYMSIIKSHIAINSDEEQTMVIGAYNNLGYIYELKKEYENAIINYKNASNFGSTFASLNLAYLYENGLGVKPDKQEADRLYELGKKSRKEWEEVRESLAKDHHEVGYSASRVS